MSSQLINRVLELTNEERTKVGLEPLKLNAKLTKAADNHSDSMAEDDFFSHTGTDGSSVGDRVANNGYEYSTVGENIAAGQTTAEAVVQAWMDSPGHRANILNANYTEIGIGYEFLENDTGTVNYNHYWTQVFGTSINNDSQQISEDRESLAIETNDFDDYIIPEDNTQDYITGNTDNSVLTGGRDSNLSNINEPVQISDLSQSNYQQFYNLLSNSWLGSRINNLNNREEIEVTDAEHTNIDRHQCLMQEYQLNDI